MSDPDVPESNSFRVAKNAQELADEIGLDLAAYRNEGMLIPTGKGMFEGMVLRKDVELLIEKLAGETASMKAPTAVPAQYVEAGEAERHYIQEVIMPLSMIPAIKWTEGVHIWMLDEHHRGEFILRIFKQNGMLPQAAEPAPELPETFQVEGGMQLPDARMIELDPELPKMKDGGNGTWVPDDEIENVFVSE